MEEIQEQLENLTLHVKAPLKWSGGKSEIIETILKHIPDDIHTYYEPFLGSGTVLLNILQRKSVNRCVVADINPHIINMYLNIRNNLDRVVKELKELEDEYYKFPTIIKSRPKTNIQSLEEARESKSNYFYYCRNKFNKAEDKEHVRTTALFIFLNKTCFRGLYRENKNALILHSKTIKT
eukprot:768711-Hanusia_phi.AAC.3